MLRRNEIITKIDRILKIDKKVSSIVLKVSKNNSSKTRKEKFAIKIPLAND